MVEKAGDMKPCETEREEYGVDIGLIRGYESKPVVAAGHVNGGGWNLFSKNRVCEI